MAQFVVLHFKRIHLYRGLKEKDVANNFLAVEQFQKNLNVFLFV